jgi:hypothetical protein
VAGGGHGGGARSVMAATVPALLDWRWKKPAELVGPKRPSGLKFSCEIRKNWDGLPAPHGPKCRKE